MVFHSFGEYGKAEESYERALVITKEIGDKQGEGTSYGNLGTVFRAVGKYDKAREYHEKAVAIKNEIGDRNGEAIECENLKFSW